MLKRAKVVLLAVLLLCGTALFSATPVGAITLAWDASPDLTVVGYTLYYGLVGSNTTNSTTVGNATITTLGNLQAGATYFFFVTAYNAQLLESDPSNIITDTPLPANTAPVLSPIFNRTIAVSTQLIFYATAADADTEQTLAYSLSGAPVGASINPVTGQFVWTPSPSQSGQVYTITINVTDNGTPALNSAATFNVTVIPLTGTTTPPAGPSNFRIFLPASP